jgi:hypothetical protein
MSATLLNRLVKLEGRQRLTGCDVDQIMFVSFVDRAGATSAAYATCAGQEFHRAPDESLEALRIRIDTATRADARPPNMRAALLKNHSAVAPSSTSGWNK